jgi:hypothetical protein
LNLKGRTEKIIAALIYTDIKDNPDTIFIKLKTKPVRFYLKNLPGDLDENSKKKIFSQWQHPDIVEFIWNWINIIGYR